MPLKRETRFQHELLEDYEDGECIFEEGDTGRDLYIIQNGSVQIRKKINDSTIEMAVFNKGDFFGDMALLQSLPRYASAHAIGNTKLLILKPAGFLLKIRRDPTFAFEMLQQLSFRVKLSNDRLLEIVQRHQLPMGEVQNVLKIIGGGGGGAP
ncbi:MAG: cyclic nucleotide-binding domain-containing protein [Bdellovibrionales bacterium]|nr:cyclic nucleotide-binding domain-containing protein [Oligoflexia bacterium]